MNAKQYLFLIGNSFLPTLSLDTKMLLDYLQLARTFAIILNCYIDGKAPNKATFQYFVLYIENPTETFN